MASARRVDKYLSINDANQNADIPLSLNKVPAAFDPSVQRTDSEVIPYREVLSSSMHMIARGREDFLFAVELGELLQQHSA